MSRGVACGVCTLPAQERIAIEAMLHSGVKRKLIAQEFPVVSTYALSQHKNKCLAPAPGPELSGDTEEIATWMRRCQDVYLQASANQDIRSAVSALSAAFRGLAYQDRAREKAEAQKTEHNSDGPDAPLTLVRLDKIVEEYSQRTAIFGSVEWARLKLSSDPELRECLILLIQKPELRELLKTVPV
jgi:hypothetical protein